MALAGEVRRSVSRLTGAEVVLIDTALPGGDWIDADGGRWVTICEEHGTTCCHATRAIAVSHMPTVSWCEDCTAGVA